MIFLYGCTFNSEEESEEIEIEKTQEELMDELSNFAKSKGYGDAEVIELSSLDDDFTINIQNKYVGHQIACYAYVDDVYQKDGNYYIVFQSFLTNNIAILKCNELISNNITNSASFDEWYYADEVKIVAQIIDIKPAFFSIYADGYEEEGIDLSIDTDRTLIIKGECLELEIPNID